MAHGIQFTPAGSIEGSDDVEIVRGSDLIIVTAGAKQQPGSRAWSWPARRSTS